MLAAPMSCRQPRLAAVVLILHCLAGCSGRSARDRVILLGFDGMDPDVVELLMSEGKLPNLAKIRQGGAHGRLRSMKPILSPVVWTTIATGKTPDQHQIGHFTAVNQATGEQLPVTSRMRKTKAIWNVLSDRSRSVSVIGWWATWPAETVSGSIVSDHLCYHFLFEEGIKAGKGRSEGNTYPPELEKEIAPLVVRPGDLGPADIAPFVNVSRQEFDRPFAFDDELGHFKWALATARSYRAIGLKLWEEKRPDLLMVYFEGTDSTSHLFGHLFRATGLAGELAEQQKRYGEAVEKMYVYADSIAGDFMKAMDGRTTLVIVSDHGFNLGALPDDPSRTRDMRRVSEQYHDIDGVLYLHGARVKPYTRIDGATILDVAPTLLALTGVPAAKDMPGRVLSEALQVEPLPTVPTYETGGSAGAPVAGDAEVDEEILAKLRSLGYLNTASPSGDRNLAAVLFEQGRYAESAEAYQGLVANDPNDGALRASLAGALGAMGRYDEALEQINEAIRLQPLNPEAYHNRAVIHERKGDVPAAVADYETALRYSPQYEPARASLRRLQGSDRVFEPKTEAEKQAYALADQASQAARRGAYADAMKKLDQAQKIAPRFALLYQYRSNVAYLMGDRAGAVAALEQGLRIEPDNVLFKENLRRLRQQAERP
jgi:predicted AlkP superfamily phosphohydrolase/phosphomutase